MAWNGPDAIRPLSDKGRGQSERVGAHLAALGFTTDALISSPKLRCVQTAEIVAGYLGVNVDIDERLAGSLDLATVEAVLHEAGDPERPVLVGHDPDFGELLASLSAAAGIPMRKGTLARIEVDRPLQAGAGTLRWLLPPDLLKPER
jgi:phosphohistidine phosphatase SixA